MTPERMLAGRSVEKRVLDKSYVLNCPYIIIAVLWRISLSQDKAQLFLFAHETRSFVRSWKILI